MRVDPHAEGALKAGQCDRCVNSFGELSGAEIVTIAAFGRSYLRVCDFEGGQTQSCAEKRDQQFRQSLE